MSTLLKCQKFIFKASENERSLKMEIKKKQTYSGGSLSISTLKLKLEGKRSEALGYINL